MPEILYYDESKKAWLTLVTSDTVPTALDASVINSGVLAPERLPTISIEKGGTGATNAADALNNLGGLPKTGGTITGSLGINGNANIGGTLDMGGNKIVNAALGILYAKTLLANGWSGNAAPYIQTLAVDGVSVNNPPRITPNYTNNLDQDLLIKEAAACVDYARVNTNGQILFVCLEDKPTYNIPLQIEVPF